MENQSRLNDMMNLFQTLKDSSALRESVQRSIQANRPADGVGGRWRAQDSEHSRGGGRSLDLSTGEEAGAVQRATPVRRNKE